ncbi:MAG TPA: two-component regulator propeller domain-containing protein, partial [Phnomibacter sp.]|nr:two-component regulator propeller domain-containing protein [Phnomibacter sp.]
RGGSQTWAIDQDPGGRIYFANNEGLTTFDGTYWRVFQLPNRTIVRSVRVADDGKVYVGGQGEAGYFLPDKTGNLVYYSIRNLVPENSRDFADVWDIEIVGDVVFFRITDRILRLANGSIEVFPAPSEWVFIERMKGRLIAQDKQLGLFQWSGQQWLPIANGKISENDLVNGYIPLGQDSLLLVTLYRRDLLLTRDALKPVSRNVWSLQSEVVSIVPLNENEYMVGTTGEGCLVVNNKGEWIQRITMTEGLQDNSIQCLFRDRMGNVWAGLNNGISMIAYNAPIKFIKPGSGKELTGYASKVHDGRLYIATNDGAYSVGVQQQMADLGFTKGSFARVPNSYGLAYRFDVINQQLLMAHNEGTFVIKGNNAEKLSADPSWTFTPTSNVLPVSRVLVGTYTGLKWLKYENGRFNVTGNLRGLRESFRFLAIDNDQKVWASHPYRGIYHLEFLRDSMQYATQIYTEPDGLPDTLDNHVFRVKNRVVFATAKGVYEFNKENDRFEPSPLLGPIFGNTPIRYLKEDNEGNLWFVSNKTPGLLSFHPEKAPGHSITYFPEITGQVLSGFEQIFPYDPQNVFMASEKGIILINPKKYFEAREKP